MPQDTLGRELDEVMRAEEARTGQSFDAEAMVSAERKLPTHLLQSSLYLRACSTETPS